MLDKFCVRQDFDFLCAILKTFGYDCTSIRYTNIRNYGCEFNASIGLINTLQINELKNERN